LLKTASPFTLLSNKEIWNLLARLFALWWEAISCRCHVARLEPSRKLGRRMITMHQARELLFGASKLTQKPKPNQTQQAGSFGKPTRQGRAAPLQKCFCFSKLHTEQMEGRQKRQTQNLTGKTFFAQI
jgi:hypothetical protein